MRAAAVGILLLGALLVFGWWRRREKALGQGTPLVAEGDIDGAWLERNVFALPPEVVGAAYDRRVAGSEVAAVLARMCGESKLASRVAGGARGWNNLELWLLVERDELAGHERDLIERLFGAGKTTSADRLHEQHRVTGFDPAAVLRQPLSAACDAALGVRPASRWPWWMVAGAGAVGLGLTLPADVAGILSLLLAVVAGALGFLGGALVFAPRYRRDPLQTAARARPCFALAGASVAVLALLITTLPALPALAPLSLAAWGLIGAAGVASAAATRESAAGLALRRNLVAARRFLASELERPEPRLRDEWLPYLIALELSTEVERWYQAFGRIETAARRQRLEQRAGSERETAASGSAASETAASEAASGESASSESAASESQPAVAPWTGGAGALGGIGPSGPWIAATAGLRVAASRDPGAAPIAPRRELALGVPA